MHDKPSALQNILRPVSSPASPAPLTTAEDNDEVGLPALIEGSYQPYARASNKPLSSIHFVTPKGDVRSFQYVDLDSDARFTPEQITLAFTGSTPIRVEIRGRNLWRLYDYIHQQRMRWVMVATRDFAKDGEPLVTAVDFTVVKPDHSDSDDSA